MGKTKLHKYERVQHLPNVTFSPLGESESLGSYPWHGVRYKGMERVLELGCGKGEHTLAFAAADPFRLCVGIDSKSHRICVGAEKAMALGLENVHFFRVHIERIREFFAPRSIQEIWLTFPDPHLKKRTIKNRLSAAPFLDTYAHLLIPGGRVHLKTDSEVLYAYTRESVETWGGRVVAAVNDIHGADTPGADDSGFGARDIVSSFEASARSKGATIKYLAFTLGCDREGD
ncbi:MAG: tRNA (guanosine(46)-N7)-methyltransferase TrmB [Proteobacteria bacterium]|nr:tRNA (guanosine(46)-N7)-methyltransferase TrmB [Desulfobacula sp.]MBU3951544.1 tRNA (guanosine(46)-N7)-methyltransferase TrmB [Pseudomonadota bacterium]MBU4129402.1 tRNA (guanosine(46)-N7)-methyltransferase TrmB [Pseudomonadota bacterium]